MLGHLSKPWFVYRPSQLARRALRWTTATPGLHPLETAWGATIVADPSRTIGHSIVTTGVFDLAVSEVLARLIDRGATVVDAGANVGYMTVLAATASGATGRVLAFEPHPELFAVLQQNIERYQSRFTTRPAAKHDAGPPAANVTPHNIALGDRDGVATLVVPTSFGSNDGTAHLAVDGTATPGVPVNVRRLDAVLGNTVVDVMKLDVEGFEAQVLMGAARALGERRIRHVIFEDHDVTQSGAARVLRDTGYTLFAVGWTLNRLVLQPLAAGPLAHAYEAPSFIATREPELVVERCRATGWHVLRPNLV